MRRAASAALTLACLLLSACNTAGPRAVRGARFPYNEALIQTWNEQLLLNLVRLRYRDTPYFLQATSLTTQYSLSGSASAGATLIEGGGDEGSLGTGVSIAETPTVSYVPLQGEDFVKQMLRRVPLDDVMLLPQSGWSIERVMRLTVDEIDGIPNAPSATGPTPDRRPEFAQFICLTETLRALQKDRRLQLRVEPWRNAGNGADEAEHDRFRYSLRLLGGAPLPRDLPACRDGLDERVARLLPPETEQPIRYSWSNQAEGINLTTRSLLGTLYYLSQAVEIPARHLDERLATRTGAGASGCSVPASPGLREGERSADRGASGTGQPDDWTRALYDRLFRVHCSADRPDRAFVSVRYRNHWFYVADHDLESKSTWGLLAQLVSLQAGGENRGLIPALTLSAGR